MLNFVHLQYGVLCVRFKTGQVGDEDEALERQVHVGSARAETAAPVSFAGQPAAPEKTPKPDQMSSMDKNWQKNTRTSSEAKKATDEVFHVLLGKQMLLNLARLLLVDKYCWGCFFATRSPFSNLHGFLVWCRHVMCSVGEALIRVG